MVAVPTSSSHRELPLEVFDDVFPQLFLLLFRLLRGVDVKPHPILINAIERATAIAEITIKDEENEFDAKEFKEEYEKIHRDAEEYTISIIKALNELHVYFRYHIKKGLALGKGLKILRYQDFTKKNNQAQKRKEKKRKEIKKKKEDVEDEYNVFCNEIFISTL